MLQRIGEGVYMTALEVDDVDKAVEELEARGVPLIDANQQSRDKGIPVIIHPKASRGMMFELIEAVHDQSSL